MLVVTSMCKVNASVLYRGCEQFYNYVVAMCTCCISASFILKFKMQINMQFVLHMYANKVNDVT